MGRLIPAGTGMEYYRNIKLEPDKTAEEELEAGEIPAGDDIKAEAKEVGD